LTCPAINRPSMLRTENQADHSYLQRQIQERYEVHRTTRNQQQKEKILSPHFEGWVLDDVLTKLDGPRRDPHFVDPRNCLVFWARPPRKIRNLIEPIQQRLMNVAPGRLLLQRASTFATVDMTLTGHNHTNHLQPFGSCPSQTST